MKKILYRILLLWLIACMTLPLLVACDDEPSENEKSITVDNTFKIVYATASGEAGKSAAFAFREAVKDVLGFRPEVSTDRALNGEWGSEAVLFIGDICKFENLTPLDKKSFTFTFDEAGPVLRAGDEVTLYLATRKLAKLWVTEEYGYKNGQLTLSTSLCKKLAEVDVGANELISVMSQNIRCVDDPDGNYISDRKGRFKQLMEAYQPDLLGTQETTAKWNGIFEDYFGDEYGMVGCSRDGEDAETGEWNTILYKKSRFDLIESGNFWLTATPDTPSFTEGAICRRICTWAILKDKITGGEIFFANTHLDHSNDTVRGLQAEYLMDFLADYADDYPLYLTGDFNTGNKNDPYKTITKELSDSHKTADVDASAVEGTYHAYGKYTPGEIDFCFHNDRSDTVLYRILSEKYGGYVSDHYGLISYFTVQ